MAFRVFVPLAAVLLASCAQSVETRLSSTGQSALSPASFSFSDDKVATPALRQARNLVADSLRKRGFQSGENGEVYLEVTLAERPASLAIGTAAGRGSLSPAKRRKPLQNCVDREYRVGIVLTRIADGSVVYQGSAAEHHCKLQLAEALPYLVEMALADLGSPRGSYAVRRRSRD